jgi:hypothetical protein
MSNVMKLRMHQAMHNAVCMPIDSRFVLDQFLAMQAKQLAVPALPSCV